MDKTKHADRKSNHTLETLKELAYYVLPHFAHDFNHSFCV